MLFSVNKVVGLFFFFFFFLIVLAHLVSGVF